MFRNRQDGCTFSKRVYCCTNFWTLRHSLRGGIRYVWVDLIPYIGSPGCKKTYYGVSGPWGVNNLSLCAALVLWLCTLWLYLSKLVIQRDTDLLRQLYTCTDWWYVVMYIIWLGKGIHSRLENMTVKSVMIMMIMTWLGTNWLRCLEHSGSDKQCIF